MQWRAGCILKARRERERRGGPEEATMKRFTKYMTAAAAVLMATAGVASAQGTMKAEVPFAFHVGSQVMEPGTITVRMLNTNRTSDAMIVSNPGAKRAYTVLPRSVRNAPKDWAARGEAKLAFDCSSGTCILAKVWYGEGYAYDFYGPKKKSGETMLTEIVMKPDRAD